MMPPTSGAWPWDDNRDITVTGDLTCFGFDVSGKYRNPMARVEGFEIRGRSGVLKQGGHGLAASYKVKVPSGWHIEWSMKCSNERHWINGGSANFTVNKTVVGSSYDQRREICVNGGLSPCVPHDFGGCVLLLINDELVPKAVTFEDALGYFLDAYGPSGGPNDIQSCLSALRKMSGLKDEKPVPRPQTTVATIPTPTSAPLPALPTVPAPITTQILPPIQITPIPPPVQTPSRRAPSTLTRIPSPVPTKPPTRLGTSVEYDIICLAPATITIGAYGQGTVTISVSGAVNVTGPKGARSLVISGPAGAYHLKSTDMPGGGAQGVWLESVSPEGTCHGV